MHLLDGALVVSPTDLTRFLACRHLTRLDVEVARGERPAPADTDEALEIAFRRGLEHEHRWLEGLRAAGRQVVDLAPARFGPGADGLRAAEAATVEALAAGADVVYQGTFFDGAWRGHADFLVRRDTRPDGRTGTWPWTYDVVDTKLARRLTVPALLQLAAYAERLTALQGVPPAELVVVTGDGHGRAVPHGDVAAYARRVRAAFTAFTAAPPPTRAVPVPHCGQCRWRTTCAAQWAAADDLSQVAGLRTAQADALRAHGVTTVADLAAADPATLPRAAAADPRRLVAQAALQVAERSTGVPQHRLLPPAPGRGLALLPEPSPGDVFFDIEGDPFAADGVGLEYLFGVVRAGRYHCWWATDPADERAAFEALVDMLVASWRADPGMHVYHYAAYEPTRLKTLAGRYDTRVDEVDRLLRGGRFVDLHTVVRQGLQIGKASYSLKRLEDHYWGHGRDAAVGDALSSVVAFERWLVDHDDALLEDVRAYNEVDCRSTQALRDWLEERRAEGGGDAVHARPEHGDGVPSAAVAARADRAASARAALLASLPADAEAGEAAAARLLADLVDWHRREALPQWSEFFRRRCLTGHELVADPVAVGGLTLVGPDGEAGPRSTRWRLAFPPQETALVAGDQGWADPVQPERLGRVLAVDAGRGELVVARASDRPPPALTAAVPPGPVPADDLAARLADLADWVAGHGVDHPGDRWRAARDLLLRRPPVPGSGPLRRPGESAEDVVLRLAQADRPVPAPGVLAVQGPPGTGKTRIGARLVLAALAAGQRVGLCAYSHAAVGTLLAEVARQAAERGTGVAAVQKSEPEQVCAAPGVRRAGSVADVAAALADGSARLVAGTPWLFAAPALDGAVDLLVVDEAGQLSLANVLAVSAAARRLVLLGDPQQLCQPVVGTHPPGAGVSALEHVLAGRSTVPDDLGVLLDVTHRMHPAVAGVVSDLSYDGRLRVAPGCERQAVAGAGPLSGSGVRWVPVQHEGCSTSSAAEADVVAGLVAQALAGATWTPARGGPRPLVPADVLVLAPYNRQVHLLAERLAERGLAGVEVGTVDRMQGRQAAVVVCSLTASSADDAPRGVGFLADRRRLVVALSRARAVVAVVGSPRLLLAPATTLDALRRVNALCVIADAGGTAEVVASVT